MRMTPRQANAAVWVIAAAPTVLALAGTSSNDWSGSAATFNALGRISGIAGMACLLVAATLSCRVPGFDVPFGGLTKLWKTHHQLGGAGFLLLLAHPPLLSLSAAYRSLDAAAQTLLPATPDFGITTGWIALLAMMAFLAPSFALFGEPEYRRWRLLHRLAAVAVVAAVAHASLLGRSLPGHAGMAVWLLLCAGALASVAWRFVFSRRGGRLRYIVESATAPANNVIELTLAPIGGALVYSAGQFIYLTPHDKTLAAGRGEEHPYTLTSTPAETVLRVAIKGLGDATRAIQSIAPGSEVDVEGPYGAFFPRSAQSGPEVWIAGGIGIAPFLGRLRDLAARGAGLDLQLVYCVQDPARAYFVAELEQLAARVPGARITMHYFYMEGSLSGPFLAAHCKDLAGRRAYVCGPEPLIALAQSLLLAAGVRRDRIVTEEFTLL